MRRARCGDERLKTKSVDVLRYEQTRLMSHEIFDDVILAGFLGDGGRPGGRSHCKDV